MRFRPLALGEEDAGRCVALDCARRSVVLSGPTGDSTAVGREFAFDTVLGEDAGQEAVWGAVAGQCARVLDGYTAALLVYGQSGTGKTHTMGAGGSDASPQRGLVQRAAELLCARAAGGEASAKSPLTLSVIEVYQEHIKYACGCLAAR